MPISENGVSFFGAGGHNHNGINSTLIDANSYSIFDFKTGFVGSPTRISIQQINSTALEDWVVRVVNSKVLQPAGIDLSPDSLSGKSIRANTITATQLQANTITADEIAANTITANELVSNIVLVNNTIQSSVYSAGSSGWQISNTGSAEFNNVTVRGTVAANSGNVGGWSISSSQINAGSTYLYSNGQATFGNTIIYSNGNITNGGFSVTANGVLSANAGTFQGSLSGANITGATGTFSGSVLVSDGTNGLEITTDGYIRGVGSSGVRIKSSDGTAGATQLFKNDIYTLTSYASLFTASSGDTSSFEADGNGVRVSTTNNRPLDLQRNFVTDAHFIRFYKTSGTPGESGKIRFNAANGLVVAYDTTSDERLKINIKKLSNGIEIIKKINPVEYSFIEDSEGVSHGFIAQELYKVYDKPVYKGGENPREDPWSIDYSKMVPILTKALQEAIDKIESLEKRLQDIEGV